MDTSLQIQAKSLMASVATQCSSPRGFGTMSPSIYDSAWLSMIQKPECRDTNDWLFPRCFDYILSQQLSSGAWESYASPIDGILNTAACLLAIIRRLNQDQGQSDLRQRRDNAQAALAAMLGDWNPNLGDHVGFELLVVKLITLLEDEGVILDFPELGTLKEIQAAKLKKLPPSTAYSTKSTLYHSLEAFIGYIDFDQVRRWRDNNGSMMNSPASTAAYLMYSSEWDDEAEAYLRQVLEHSVGSGDGSVPCAWPTTIFETTWATTVLLGAGYAVDNADEKTISDFLEEKLSSQNQTVGFAPGSLPDADDTAKALQSLLLLHNMYSVNGLIETFEKEDHFQTYPGERNPSFSANCNILLCLLMREDAEVYLPQIGKTLGFLVAQAMSGNVNEKWHLRQIYWMMLLCQVLDLLHKKQESLIQGLLDAQPNVRQSLPILSLHLLVKILHSQDEDGSWEGNPEVTSYAIIALSHLSYLPLVHHSFQYVIIAAMARGKSFLLANRRKWTKASHLWIEKVSYASPVLCEAYCLAAAACPLPSDLNTTQAETTARAIFASPEASLLQKVSQAGSLIAKTPLFANVAPHLLRIAEVQACFYLPALKTGSHLSIFPRTAKGKDKYQLIIPLALTASSAALGGAVSPLVISEMISLSSLNFLADEYMEGVVERHFADNLGLIKDIVREGFESFKPTTSGMKAAKQNGNHDTKSETDSKAQPIDTEKHTTAEDVRIVLQRFMTHILQHPSVLSSPESVQSRLAIDAETFLLAHITHAEDNRRFRHKKASTNGVKDHDDSSQNGTHTNGLNAGGTDTSQVNGAVTGDVARYTQPGRSFYAWVRSTSADHTSCPYSFVFFNCLIQACSSKSTSVFSSARLAYLAEDLCRHLASLCRMYNDYGSLQRDIDEGNLNSVNFPEFHQNRDGRHSKKRKRSSTLGLRVQEVKNELLWIAEYERVGLEKAFAMLDKELGVPGKQTVDALRFFVNVTDLYGQIYVLRDVGTRTQ